MDRTTDPTCPLCRESPQTVEHWIVECAGTIAARQDVFGTTNAGLNILTSDPKGAVELARRPYRASLAPTIEEDSISDLSFTRILQRPSHLSSTMILRLGLGTPKFCIELCDCKIRSAVSQIWTVLHID